MKKYIVKWNEYLEAGIHEELDNLNPNPAKGQYDGKNVVIPILRCDGRIVPVYATGIRVSRWQWEWRVSV